MMARRRVPVPDVASGATESVHSVRHHASPAVVPLLALPSPALDLRAPPIGELKAEERQDISPLSDAFCSWITANTHGSAPPMAGMAAGAVRRVGDGDLPMFRDRCVPATSPSAATRRQRVRSGVGSGADTDAGARLVRSLIDQHVVALPQLSRPSRVGARHKEDRQQLLAQCHSKGSGIHGDKRAERLPPDNQHGTERAIREPWVIPDDIFFLDNSAVGRSRVDLSAWACLCREEGPVLDQIATHLTARCQELSLRGLAPLTTVAALHRLLEPCPHLKTLDLAQLQNLSKPGLITITRLCPALESLTFMESDFLTDDSLRAVILALPQLTHLDVSDCPHLTDAALLVVAVHLPRLERLCIDRCGHVSDRGLLAVIKARGPHLRVLSLRGLRHVTRAVIPALWRSNPRRLETLNVSDNTAALTDAGMEYLTRVPSISGPRATRALYELRGLDLAGCAQLSSLSCSWLAAACPYLTVLSCARCRGICDRGLRALASLVWLRELDLSGCPQLTDAGVVALLRTDGTSASPSLSTTHHLKPLTVVSLAGCTQVGAPTVAALRVSCATTLESLDLSGIAPCEPSVLVQLAQSCRALTMWRCRAQDGITRVVLARLASRNTVLTVLDLRDCANVDDLALYPLLVMQSLRELRLSRAVTTSRALASLPPRLKHLELSYLSAAQLDDAGCLALATRARSHLETIDLTGCLGVSAVGVTAILRHCPHVYAVNVFQCPHVTLPTLGHALRTSDRDHKHSSRHERYAVELIEDPDQCFCGIGVVDMEAARRARRRETDLARATQQQRAAVRIQVHFRSRTKAVARRQQQDAQRWHSQCAAIDIQRVVRGRQCRREYALMRERVTPVVVLLQTRWRHRRHQRRVRRALGFWTTRALSITFRAWTRVVHDARRARVHAAAALQATRALSFWSGKTLARVLAAWHAYTRRRATRVRLAVGLWKCQSLPRVLAAWARETRARRHARLRLSGVFLTVADLETHNSSRQRVLVAIANTRASRVFWRRWRAFIADQKRFVLQTSLAILSGSLRHWAFRQWRAAARDRRSLRERHRRLLGKLLHHTQHRVWVAWRAFVAHQRARRRAWQRFTASSLTTCWLRWRQYVDHTQRLRTVSTRIVARLTRVELVRAVATWHAVTHEARRTRAQLRRALAFLLQGVLMRMFVAWASWCAQRRVLRVRWRARHEHAHVHFAMTQWLSFVHARRASHGAATVLQALWRGQVVRHAVEDAFLMRLWATLLLQRAWRARLMRALRRVGERRARLREYLRAEREREGMDHELAAMQQYEHALALIVGVQRLWRGVAARQLFVEVRRARVLARKRHEAAQQDRMRARARQRQEERAQLVVLQQRAAVEMQRLARGFLARRWFAGQQQVLQVMRHARRVQAVYRGRVARRRTAALRRSLLTRMELLSRRNVEGGVLRAMGARTRATQRPLRGLLAVLGLDLSSFLLDVRAVVREVREDFATLRQLLDVVKNHSRSGGAGNGGGAGGRRFRLLGDLEQLVATTTTMATATQRQQEDADAAVARGEAVRIVLRGHARCGETALVLAVHEGVAQLKLDVDGALEFVPLVVPATKSEPLRRVLHRVPTMAFHATVSSGAGCRSEHWRMQLVAYAEGLRHESQRVCAARTMQCAARVYLARLRVQHEMEQQGVVAARRQRALLQALSYMGSKNTRVARVLELLHLVRPRWLPDTELVEAPGALHVVVDRFQRYLARRQELQGAMLALTPEVVQGQPLPVPPTQVLDRLVHYPLRWLQRVTRVPVARQLEKRGHHAIATLLGGAEFVKSFGERHVDARAHWFPQLAACELCASEGWALVHGVFLKRKVATTSHDPSTSTSTSRSRSRSLSLTLRYRRVSSKTTTRRVPHGWGVAHLLTGRAGSKQRDWRQRHSIEAQFKSLQLVRAMKRQEQEERLATQILVRQGTLNELRAKEGPRGFAQRHAALSALEEQTQRWYARFQDEKVQRAREEGACFVEEDRVRDVLTQERKELLVQAQRLHELQQQVPEVVTCVEMTMSPKSALEFVVVGCTLEVEFDDGQWYTCRVLALDAYDALTAEVLYLDDNQKEVIRLVDETEQEQEQEQKQVEEQKQEQEQQQQARAKKKAKPTTKRNKKKQSVAEIMAAAAAASAAAEIPFRPWRAGKAVAVAWEPPPDNGAAITQYTLEWRDETDESVHGTSVVQATAAMTATATRGGQADDEDDRELTLARTTLWPIPPTSETTLQLRVSAENAKGMGLASVFLTLPDELTEVSHRTAVRLTRPPPSTVLAEQYEREVMALADAQSLARRRELTCTVCHDGQWAGRALVDEHMARAHAVPLICPFRSCQQVCASERALRYHLWRCTVPTPTTEEQQSASFLELFALSRQYCLRKPRRHVLAAAVIKALQEEHAALDGRLIDALEEEEAFLEGKYEEARAAWLASAAAMHERNLEALARDRARAINNAYVAPAPLFGVDFVDAEPNMARREAVVATRDMLRADREAYELETTTKLDAMRHEQRELQDYMALKSKRMQATEEDWQRQSLERERKKARKTLRTVESNITQLVATSTARIAEMTTELERLTVLEQAFVPFTHQVIKTQRLARVLRDAHTQTTQVLTTHGIVLGHYQEELRLQMARASHEVAQLEAWDAMVAARRRQLEALSEELAHLQRVHVAEVEALQQRRDAGDEAFALHQLRQKQEAVALRRARRLRELMAAAANKRTRGELARAAHDHANDDDDDDGAGIETKVASLQIANHDLPLHRKFVQGKSADAEYLREDDGMSIDHDKDHDKVHEGGGVAESGGDALETALETEHSSPSPMPLSVEATASEPGGGMTEASDGLATTTTTSSVVDCSSATTTSSSRRFFVRLECEFVDGRIHGTVRIEFSDGSVYVGPWVEHESYDKPATTEPLKTRRTDAHWGQLTMQDGTLWEGEDVDNWFVPATATSQALRVTVAHGQERLVFTGAVRHGYFHGLGTLVMQRTYSRGEYTGEWRVGQRHGFGIERWDSGERYQGTWVRDRYHGQGELEYDDGSRFVGQFCRGQWHGSGVRTLANGDQLSGVFTHGALQGEGVLAFADGRHYVGSFQDTRRCGLGTLTFPSGERYEGPFEKDEMHGDGQWVSASGSGSEAGASSGSAPLVRRGRWEYGHRVAWLSEPSSQLATATFVRYFADVETVEGEEELTLRPAQFRTPYAVLVAGLLPSLPRGVDADDPFVDTVVRMLAKTQTTVVGANVLAPTRAKLQRADQERALCGQRHEQQRDVVEERARVAREQMRRVVEWRDTLARLTREEEAMQVTVESFWKQRDAQQLERQYKAAVASLHACTPMDWYRLRTATLDDTLLSLLRAFAVLLTFTSNAAWQQQHQHQHQHQQQQQQQQAPATLTEYVPSRLELMRLLSSSDENVHLGDREALIHRYAVRALYVLPLFDAYSFAEGARLTLLRSLSSVVHHPRLRPDNVRLHQLSPALAAICVWVRAAVAYATRASEIAPTWTRVLRQLVVLQHTRRVVAQEEAVLATAQREAAEAQLLLAEQAQALALAEQEVQALTQVLAGVEALDRAEFAPLAKARVRRPRGGARRRSEEEEEEEKEGGAEEEDDDEEEVREEEKKRLPRTDGDVIERQVFEEDHGRDEADAKTPRRTKEDVLRALVGDATQAAEWGLLQKEVRKVLERSGGCVPLAQFPAAFEEVMLRPVVPAQFGVKKLRTLLEMLPETCVIVAPQVEGEEESVRLTAEGSGEEEGQAAGTTLTTGMSTNAGPLPPRLAFCCRLCPGKSYATASELAFHERTKWHYWNVQAKREGHAPLRFTVAATFWSEVYDSRDNSVCFYNQMTGEMAPGHAPPREVQADELMLELLADVVPEEQGERTTQTEDGGEEREEEGKAEGGQGLHAWEEVADSDGNVYFYNRGTGESRWTRLGEGGAEDTTADPTDAPVQGGGGCDQAPL